MTSLETCTFKPFVSQVVPPKADLDALASGMNLLVGQLENYFRELLASICRDLQQSGSAASFLELSDTPDSYAGAANNFVRVNAGETGLTFFAATLVTTFLQLSDVPNSYAGAGLDVVRVNAAENALEFFTMVFTALGDTPSSYAGFAGSLVSVNATATGLEFSGGAGTSLGSLLTILTRGMFLSSGVAAIGFGNSFTVVIDGATQTVAAPATTSLITSFERVTQTSANAQNRAAGARHSSNRWFRGNSAGFGGFRVRTRIGTTTSIANQRMFIGWFGFAGADFTLTQNPSQQVNIFGVGYDSADTNLFVIHNDGAGAATKVDLGANFPKNSTSVYDIEIWSEPNDTEIHYIVTNLGTGDQASGDISTEIPANTQLLMPYFWLNSGAGGTAVVLNIIHVWWGLFGG